MSLAEIEKAVASLSPEELARLAAFIARQDKLAWDEQLEADFAEGGRLRLVLNKADEDIRAGRFSDLP